MTAETISIRTSGLVTVSLVTPEGSKPVASFHNDMQATGRAVVARALYSPAMSLNCMYMLYWNGTTGSFPVITPSSGTVTAAALRTEAANYGYVRVPIIQTGLSGDDGNIITLQGITAAAAAPSSLADGVSRFFAAALVMAPDPDDAADDILFSAANFTAGGSAFDVTKVTNAQVGVSWQVTIAIGS